jgi:hypothetical protein
LAGKPFVVDDFKVEQMEATKAITASQLDDLLQEGQIVRFKSSTASVGTIDTSIRRAWARRER